MNAKKTGKFADGIITVGAADEKMGMLWGKFEEGAREAGKDPSGAPKMLQIHVSWAPTDQEAIDQAVLEWPNGGMAFFPKQDIKNPEDFAAMAKLVRPEDFTNRVLMSSDLKAHTRTSSTTWTWASTRSICTTSAATRPSSSRSSARRSSPTCASAEAGSGPGGQGRAMAVFNATISSSSALIVASWRARWAWILPASSRVASKSW